MSTLPTPGQLTSVPDARYVVPATAALTTPQKSTGGNTWVHLGTFLFREAMTCNPDYVSLSNLSDHRGSSAGRRAEGA